MKNRLALEGLDKFAQCLEGDISIISQFNDIQSWEDAHNKANLVSFSNWPIDRKTVSILKDEAQEKRAKIKKDFSSSIENVKVFSSAEAMKDISEMEPILKALTKLTLEFKEAFSNAKKEKNIIDFHDMEHFALQILVKKDEDGKYSKTDVAKEYSEKFDEIAIDEYQDSNLIQDYILNTISKQNNIFMVGDVKQSIYRFRGARPQLFLEKYEKYSTSLEDASEGIKVLLFKNFRSREEILNLTNEVFMAIMSKKLGEIEYNQEEFLNYGANYEDSIANKNSFKPELHVIDTKETEDEEEIVEPEEDIDTVQMEARLVANRIQEIINSNYQVKDKNGCRNATYKDMTILLRASNSVANVYEKELTQKGIPVFSDVSNEYFSSSEVSTILSLLKIIDNPNQDIDLVTVLRSPIYHFDDNELISIRLTDRKVGFYQALTKAAEETEEPLKTKINYFLDQLSCFRKKQEYMPLHEFIWHLYESTGYTSYITLVPNGALKLANLKMLFQRARDFENARFTGLYNFVNYIERLKRKNQDFGAAKIIGENENVVRIMSIHKSKGLEFPIVFLCGIGKEFNFRDLNEKILLHQDLGFGPKYTNYSRKIEFDTLAREAIKIVSKQESISEEMRVLYVALTRAKEKLIIIGSQNDLDKKLNDKTSIIESLDGDKIPSEMIKRYKTYLDWIELAYLKSKKENKDIMELYVHKQNEFDSKKEENDDAIETISYSVDPVLKEKIKEQIEWNYPRKSLASIPSKSSVTSLKQHDTETVIECKLEEPEFEKVGSTITGAERGTAMHYVLQRLDLRRDYTSSELQDFVNELVVKKLLTEQEAKSINLDKINKFLKSDIGKEIKSAQKIYQEKPFYIYIPVSEICEDKSNEKVLVQGIIDLYYKNSEGKITLVDYKTDFVENDNTLIEKYKSQIDIYKRAIEMATNEKVHKCYIYSLYLNKAIEI
ncbi:MAG: helicase-exonuclease AddAB subunit AddA [Clostridia bacterium]|nr:helicase-exonuclease AddAB subunit AddA [Clostridia bacterium]